MKRVHTRHKTGPHATSACLDIKNRKYRKYRARLRRAYLCQPIELYPASSLPERARLTALSTTSCIKPDRPMLCHEAKQNHCVPSSTTPSTTCRETTS